MAITKEDVLVLLNDKLNNQKKILADLPKRQKDQIDMQSKQLASLKIRQADELLKAQTEIDLTLKNIELLG